MKKLIFILSVVIMLIPINIKASNDVVEEKLFSYYNKAASCAVAFNYQQRYARIANLIDNGTNSANLIANLEPAIGAWVTISSILEKLLVKHYSWTDELLATYRQDQFNRINIIAGRDFFTQSPEQFLSILFGVTKDCPRLAFEIQEFVQDFNTEVLPPDTTIDEKPKRKM